MKYLGLEDTVIRAISHLFTAMFPHHFGEREEAFDVDEKTERENRLAQEALTQALFSISEDAEQAERQISALIGKLPAIQEMIETDIAAAYEGDPAAQGPDEVILTYPAFRAISIYRIAHELYRMQIPILPRMMTEYAHRMTGIDIHPGAEIGRYFFIDHGTGVVIGETATIGEHVKLYQHVTLGAKSFEANADGTLVKGIKRHPDIGDFVVIYAGATILGGTTVIGHHSVIGGNVWLTHSIAPHEVITTRACAQDTHEKKGEDEAEAEGSTRMYEKGTQGSAPSRQRFRFRRLRPASGAEPLPPKREICSET